jgi:ribonuclease D
MQPEVVTDQAGLKCLADLLSAESLIAFDLEADSLHHYREKVCLLQFATRSKTFIVDPLALPDVAPLGSVLAAPEIRKVLHGADYDIRSLHRDYGFEMTNLFDTMIACQFLGEKEFGLAAILRKRFGVELDKKYQKADWSRRPLSPEMLAYAAEDTRLLPELHDQLVRELAAKGRLSWVEEECRLLSGVRQTSREGEALFLRFKGGAKLDRRSLAVLDEILRFRDDRGRRQDLPPFRILGTETVLELALKKPMEKRDLEGLMHLPTKLAERHGDAILAAVSRAMAVPENRLPAWPSKPRPQRDPRLEQRLKMLKEWREAKARELELEPGVMANNALLEALAGLDAMDEWRSVPGMRAWQKEAFGPELTNLLF